MISNEDCEALLILIEERKEAEENMLLKQEIKNIPFEISKIKDEQQTDWSCDKQRDATDSTGPDLADELKKKISLQTTLSCHPSYHHCCHQQMVTKTWDSRQISPKKQQF